jgi:hypothetical protein
MKLKEFITTLKQQHLCIEINDLCWKSKQSIGASVVPQKLQAPLNIRTPSYLA